MKTLLQIIFLFFSFSLLSQQTSIISPNSIWKFLDNGSNQGTAWQLQSFNDATWLQGNSELGYGDSDEATVVSYGSSSSNKFISTYFRKNITVNNPSQFFSLDLQAIRDDGIVVYINGTEVWRDNMPTSTINYTTLASSGITFGNESTWIQKTISASYLMNGVNTIAVEIHQDAANSSDISFNLSLNGNLSAPTATVDRGPYLNTGTSNSMIVKWRTSQAMDGKVFYGTSPTNLNLTKVDPAFTTNHEVILTGLNPSTKYYYAVGATGTTLTPSSNQTYFKTSPAQGQNGNYKFWVIGDAGMGDNNQRNVKNGFLNYIGNNHIDGWLWLGDNAYDNGYDSQYQSNVFSNNTYENELKRMVVWPAPGNHDYNNHIPFSPAPAYYDIFTLPKSAEAGGVSSGTEKYYSYNYGNIHFVVLDSYDEGRNTTDAMAIWLTNDLAANSMPWTIAYWHHPPYTKGSHNSDNSNFLDGELVDIRENIIPIIENGGVDLVLNGHSHCYERSYLIDGHYDYSSTFNATMKKDNSSGSYPQSCPYQKQTSVSKSNKGTVYAVVGSSGKLGTTSSGWPHPVMYSYSNTTLGSMLLEINDNRLDAKFINATSGVFDKFTIVKNAGKKTVINSCPNQNQTLKPSWPNSVQWFPSGVTQDSLIVNPSVNTIYYAYDALSCIKDTFIVNMLAPVNCITTGLFENELSSHVFVYPSIINSYLETIHINHTPDIEISEINIIDVSGKRFSVKDFEHISNTKTLMTFPYMTSGVYTIDIQLADNRRIFKKIIIYEK